MTSVTMGRPVSLARLGEDLQAVLLHAPGTSTGEVRGLKAPPRRKCAPAALHGVAPRSSSCSRLSTAQGPAMTPKRAAADLGGAARTGS